MEEEDEIQSPPPSSPTGSPENGRISVTVATAPPVQLPQQQQNSLALVLPSQRNGGGGGREDCWSEGATGVLIDAWGERYLELSRGNLKQKHWKEVADIVSSREDYTKASKTDIQCKNRIDTVKKKFKLEKAKIMSGGTSKWLFFEKLDQLIGPSAKIPVTSAATASAVRVPMGIPVGIRNPGKNQQEMNAFVGGQRSRMELRKRVAVESEEEEESEESRDSIDSFPPEKRKRVEGESSKGKEKGGWGDSVKLLTQAILKFGEAYEQAESAKLQQVVEMEKQRMKFAKEMELQRMQFFMKTQLEISQLKHGRTNVNAGNHHRSNDNRNNDISDCSN